MNEWKATVLIIVLISIATSLGVMCFQLDHIITAIDMGKFMPFIYTGQ
jgi:hypothetical protein